MTLSDGTVKIATSDPEISWRSSNPAVLQVSQTGLVTPVADQGDAFVTAQLRIGNSTRSASREVIVQPAGTFRLVGTVFEEGQPGIAVPGARVEVQPGSLVATTNTLGQYRLYGVPPVADIQISANGYETRTFSLQLSANSFRGFVLPLIGERPSLTGNYTVFIDVVACQPTFFQAPLLPADLGHRAYEAEMRQVGSELVVKLTGGQFRTNSRNQGNFFNGSLVTGGARFLLGSFAYIEDPYGSYRDYPSVAERLPDGRYLVTDGSIILAGAADSGLSGVFNSGQMHLWDTNFPAVNSRPLAGCSGTITMKLIPR